MTVQKVHILFVANKKVKSPAEQPISGQHETLSRSYNVLLHWEHYFNTYLIRSCTICTCISFCSFYCFKYNN